jgi:Na+-translocating ferredoxin:NAD+ oxidoreductase RnfD subunit
VASLIRFLRTPKGLLLVILTILVSLALASVNIRQAGPSLAAAVAAAVLVDLPILRLRARAWQFPSGAILTGLIIAMVLSPHEPWFVSACTSAVAIVSKYAFRTRSANVFNPAALAVVATFYVFHTGQDWWGALPELAPTALGLTALMATGIFIADRVKKIPLVLAFLGIYYTLFTVTAFAGHPAAVAEVFRTPDLQAVLFFAFIILTDPPTSPVTYRDQLICGALVAVVSYAVFEWVGAAYYLLAGVLAGNVWEAWRRSNAERGRRERHARRMRAGSGEASRRRGTLPATSAVTPRTS